MALPPKSAGFYLYLVHCKDLLILCCISSVIAFPRMSNQNLGVENRKKNALVNAMKA